MSSNMTVVDVADNSTTISTQGPIELLGVYINTVLSAHAVEIKDGTTTKLTLPASAAAGTFYDFFGGKFLTSLIVDPNDSGTGSITVFWRRALG